MLGLAMEITWLVGLLIKQRWQSPTVQMRKHETYCACLAHVAPPFTFACTPCMLHPARALITCSWD
jgi:hypothetical protein